MGPPIFAGQPGASPAGIVGFWAVFYIWVGSELWLAWRHRLPPDAVARDRGSRFVIIGSIWLGLALGFGLATLATPTAIVAGRGAVFDAGLALMMAGMVLRWTAIRTLGRSFTCIVATRPDQRLVNTGLYRWVRHPSYSGALLSLLGTLLCLANYASLLGLIPCLAGFSYRIRVEEQALLLQLGEGYARYRRRTRALIPLLL